MKSTIFGAALVLLTQVVYAQVPGLPDCASPCLLNNLSKAGCANPTDFKCVCKSQQFVDSASSCIVSGCSPTDTVAAIGAAYQLCQSFGVTIPTTIPGAVVSTTSAPVEDTTSTVVYVTSTTVVSVPETTTATSTPVVEITSTVVSETTIAVTYPVTTLTTTASLGTGTIVPPGNTTSPTVAPPPTNSEGAAVKNVVGLGAVVMAVAGIFAL